MVRLKTPKSRDKKIKALHARLEALEIKRGKLYEEKWERDMPEDIFQSMSTRYTKEKAEMETEQTELEAEASKTRDREQDIALWMESIRRCIGVKKLTRKILGFLIDRIVVHEKQEVDGVKRQKVEIYYRFVGDISSQQA